jgi:hypothetical protein
MSSLASFDRPWGALGPTPPETLNVFLVTIAKQAERIPIFDRIVTNIGVEIEAGFEPHRILAQEAASDGMQANSKMKLGGSGSPVEADETFIGGKARNMHKSKRARMDKMALGNKTIVAGFLERGGNVKTQVINNRSKVTLQAAVKEHVQSGSNLTTDDFYGYWGLYQEYAHEIVNHAETYVSGNVHTNGIENFWSLLKRGLNGTYVSVEPFHLFRYLDEQCFRFNNRATKNNPMNDGDRFSLLCSQIVGKRLTYAELTAKEDKKPEAPF